MELSSSIDARADRRFFAAALALSAAALGLLAYLLLWHRGDEALAARLAFVPALNACFNAASAILLSLGYVAIRRKRKRVHRALMLSALGCSVLFLAGYVGYHSMHGETRYGGNGLGKALYLVLLASHVLLSMAVLPLSLTTFYLAFRQRFAVHRRVARVTLPIWLYVSVTGVVLFFVLQGSRPH